MLVEVKTQENSYEFEPETNYYWSELEVQAADKDTDHTFKALLATRNKVDQMFLNEGDVLDIHGAIHQREKVFLVAHVSLVPRED